MWGWWVGHNVAMWSADCSFAPHSQVGVDAIPHLCIVARKRLTPVFSLLSLTQAGRGSVRPSNERLDNRACIGHTIKTAIERQCEK